jgi:hypothetical protein
MTTVFWEAAMRQAVLFGWIGACAILVGPALVRAQELPKPGPEHELFKDFEGTWDAKVKFGTQESKGTAVYKLECGGMWLACEFNGEFGGQKFQGRGIDGYDADKKKYVGIWVDSMTTSPMISEGTYDPKTKTLTYRSEGKGPDGKPMKIRSSTVIKDKDHHEHQMFSTGEDGKEQLIMTIQYERRQTRPQA